MHVVTALAALLLDVGLGSYAEEPPESPHPPTDLIVRNLMAANARRAASLRAYQGRRIYNLEYTGIFGGHAEMQVEATYRAPDEKSFKIISETGSRLLIHQVLLKLLQSEREAQEDRYRKALEISPANYDFEFERTEHAPDGDSYVLDVRPKSKSKYVYKGKIWVDARDFAIARMEGTPAANPSFWVSHVEVQYQWARIGGFWLPVRNYSVTNVRMGGRAVLTIDYSDYQVTSGSEATATKTGAKDPILPNPASITLQSHF
jgi:hypothetical protein